MDYCGAVPSTPDSDFEIEKGKNKANPFENGYKPYVLKNPTGIQIEETYVLGRELGRGEFGVTYLCTDKSTGKVFACKSISKTKLRTRDDVEDVRRQVEIMKHMPPHKNIVSLKDTYEDDSAVHLVMELCEGGELFDRIVARGYYTEWTAVGITRTIVEVIQVCHKHGVMHRDLKPENFLFENKKETAALKVISFRLSVFFKPGERFNEIVGSPYYMAPEVLQRNYGPEVDVWSAGVILYILLCGVPPFWAETVQGIAQAIIRSVVDFKRDPWPKVSETAKDLVKKMLNPDPKRRLTAQEVLDHPWIQNVKMAQNVSACIQNVKMAPNVSAWIQNVKMAPNVSLGETDKVSIFRKRALKVIAEHLSANEVAEIKQGFDLMDNSKQGKINLIDWIVNLQKINHQILHEDLQILMDAVDVDKDGYLNYGEFVAICIDWRIMGNDDHLKDAFAIFDQNKSGYIEIDELREAFDELEPNNEEVIAAIILDFDTDKDGRISFEEFTAMMEVGTYWRKDSREYSRERNLSLNLFRNG